MASTAYDQLRPRSESSLRAESLLSRYPKLSASERTELTILFPRLNMVDRGLIAADERLGSNMEAFYRDHGGQLSGISARTTALALAVGMATLIFWIVIV